MSVCIRFENLFYWCHDEISIVNTSAELIKVTHNIVFQKDWGSESLVIFEYSIYRCFQQKQKQNSSHFFIICPSADFHNHNIQFFLYHTRFKTLIFLSVFINLRQLPIKKLLNLSRVYFHFFLTQHNSVSGRYGALSKSLPLCHVLFRWDLNFEWFWEIRNISMAGVTIEQAIFQDEESKVHLLVSLLVLSW